MSKKERIIINILGFLAIIIPFFFFYLIKTKPKKPPAIFEVSPPCTLSFVKNHLPSYIWRENNNEYWILLNNFIPTPPPPTPTYSYDNRVKLHWQCNEEITTFKVKNNDTNISEKCAVVKKDGSGTIACNNSIGCSPEDNRSGDIICRNFNEGSYNLKIEAIKK